MATDHFRFLPMQVTRINYTMRQANVDDVADGTFKPFCRVMGFMDNR
jgi:hypothetical protein